MGEELKKLIENLIVLAGNNALSTGIKYFKEHVNKLLCDGSVEGLMNTYKMNFKSGLIINKIKIMCFN